MRMHREIYNLGIALPLDSWDQLFGQNKELIHFFNLVEVLRQACVKLVQLAHTFLLGIHSSEFL